MYVFMFLFNKQSEKTAIIYLWSDYPRLSLCTKRSIQIHDYAAFWKRVGRFIVFFFVFLTKYCTLERVNLNNSEK